MPSRRINRSQLNRREQPATESVSRARLCRLNSNLNLSAKYLTITSAPKNLTLRRDNLVIIINVAKIVSWRAFSVKHRNIYSDVNGSAVNKRRVKRFCPGAPQKLRPTPVVPCCCLYNCENIKKKKTGRDGTFRAQYVRVNSS